jgi:hypothetical protein
MFGNDAAITDNYPIDTDDVYMPPDIDIVADLEPWREVLPTPTVNAFNM